jgi:hypothetical protein
MRIHSITGYAALAAMAGTLACASNKARTEETPQPDQAAAARDTTDSLQNPPGYRGMERDTTQVPPGQPSDTFLQNQGQGQPQDTAGYSGIERVDTTGQRVQPGQTDTTGYGQDTTGYGRDTTGAAGARDTSAARTDTTQMNQNPSGLDTTTSRTGDTTGYNPTQETRDTTAP